MKPFSIRSITNKIFTVASETNDTKLTKIVCKLCKVAAKNRDKGFLFLN